MTDISDSMLTEFINSALREIYNTLGDSAYFLRKTADVTVAQSPSMTTLPSTFARLYRLEVPSAPGVSVEWRMVRREVSDGSVIIMAERAGAYIAHYLEIPADVTSPTDPVTLPNDHVEVLVTAVCRRIAASVGNAALTSSYDAEYARLFRIMKRDCLKYDGMRQEGLVTSRATWAKGPTWSIP